MSNKQNNKGLLATANIKRKNVNHNVEQIMSQKKCSRSDAVKLAKKEAPSS